ncbi:prohibitin family protein [Psychroflexus halocasei]|uniref:Regulator of protease activity HflC, stomatin/prohibitin superfamily n=1 Tax=Psychroflexus halocasei TaxID=908615 RepID=A0A1H3ZJR2_9FLAO|nr:prohibitin family protein [Psychroflexus halocasei]SEA23897.1 Regulator of protease activity HflC, stomatin/prohibitin superfamily [Psychroflexus halocasei]
MEKLPKSIIPIVIAIIIVIIFISNSTVNINSGEAGVLFKRFGGGVVTDEPALGEGFHLVAPWNDVFVYEVRQQSIDEKMVVLSSNGLDIKLDVTIWYEPDYDRLGLLHKERGEDYLRRLILPAVRSATRTVVGRYKPEELYAQKRESIQEEMYVESEQMLKDQFVQVNRILVRDVSLPPTIKQAIERKLKQEQESLEYQYRLEKAEKEKERQRIEAEGKARANEILSASLTDKILREKGIQATIELSTSTNSKVIVIGSGDDGMPLILGGNN